MYPIFLKSASSERHFIAAHGNPSPGPNTQKEFSYLNIYQCCNCAIELICYNWPILVNMPNCYCALTTTGQ